jgi:hypothetical protein
VAFRCGDVVLYCGVFLFAWKRPDCGQSSLLLLEW